MREIRSSGSVEGVVRNGHLYSDFIAMVTPPHSHPSMPTDRAG